MCCIREQSKDGSKLTCFFSINLLPKIPDRTHNIVVVQDSFLCSEGVVLTDRQNHLSWVKNIQREKRNIKNTFSWDLSFIREETRSKGKEIEATPHKKSYTSEVFRWIQNTESLILYWQVCSSGPRSRPINDTTVSRRRENIQNVSTWPAMSIK